MATIAFVLKQFDILLIILYTSLQGILMIEFFATVGFIASFKVLKKGGIEVIKFLIVSIVLVAKAIGVNLLLGLISGSISMTGGHGASGAFGPIIQSHSLKGELSIAMACATFGLIVGSVIGGPIANRLVEKYNLKNKDKEYYKLVELESTLVDIDEKKFKVNLPRLDEKS